MDIIPTQSTNSRRYKIASNGLKPPPPPVTATVSKMKRQEAHFTVDLQNLEKQNPDCSDFEGKLTCLQV